MGDDAMGRKGRGGKSGGGAGRAVDSADRDGGTIESFFSIDADESDGKNPKTAGASTDE